MKFENCFHTGGGAFKGGGCLVTLIVGVFCGVAILVRIDPWRWLHVPYTFLKEWQDLRLILLRIGWSGRSENEVDISETRWQIAYREDPLT